MGSEVMTDSRRRGPYPIPERLNAVIIGCQLAAVTGCIYTARLVDGWGPILLLAAAFGVVMNSVYSTIHEAEHRMLFRSQRINDTAGAVMTLFFPAAFHLLRQGHIGHHLRNRSDDEAFDLYFEGEHPVWKCMQLYGVLTGLYWVVVVISNVIVLVFPFILKRKHFEFDRPSAAFMDALNPRDAVLIKIEAALVILLHSAIVWGLGIPLVTYAVMYAGFGLSWSSMQYVHHYGTERHVLEGSRNLWIWGPLDLVWLNHNWHLTHHRHPTVPWRFLPALGRRETADRGFLLWSYLGMWKGPRRATDHVENKYAGRVIR